MGLNLKKILTSQFPVWSLNQFNIFRWTLLHNKFGAVIKTHRFFCFFTHKTIEYPWTNGKCKQYIVLCVKKQKNRWVGHFTTLSGHFLANHINIFHKIELPTIILMCLTCLNLVWIKSYDIFFISCFLPFCKEKILKIYCS